MRKSKKIILTISIIAIIVILIIAGVFVFLLTDLFKSDEYLFYKYIAKNGEIISRYLANPNAENINSVKENKYSTSGTISFDLVSSNTEIANQMIPARNFSIDFKQQSDPREKKDSTQATLKFLNNNLFEVKYAHNNDLYGITSSEVINKYLTFENTNLKQLAQKYGTENTTVVPNKIETQDYSELFTISGEDSKYILETYMNVINSQISKENYYCNKGIITEVENKQIKSNCYGISINKEETKNLTLAILEQLNKDDKTLNLLLEKIKIIDSQTEMTIETLRSTTTDLIEKLQKTDEFPEIKIEVYEANGKLLKTAIVINNIETFTIYNETNDNFTRTVFTCDTNNETSQSNIANDTKNAINKKLELKNIEIAKQDDIGKSNFVMIFTIQSDNDTIKLSFQNKMTQDPQTQEINNNTTITISNVNTTHFTIKIGSTTTLADDVKVEELTNENAAIINNYTPENATKLMQAIINRLQTLYERKLTIINTTPPEINTPIEPQTNTNQNENTNTIVQEIQYNNTVTNQ